MFDSSSPNSKMIQTHLIIRNSKDTVILTAQRIIENVISNKISVTISLVIITDKA